MSRHRIRFCSVPRFAIRTKKGRFQKPPLFTRRRLMCSPQSICLLRKESIGLRQKIRACRVILFAIAPVLYSLPVLRSFSEGGSEEGAKKGQSKPHLPPHQKRLNRKFSYSFFHIELRESGIENQGLFSHQMRKFALLRGTSVSASIGVEFGSFGF